MMLLSPKYFFDFFDEERWSASQEEPVMDHSQMSLDSDTGSLAELSQSPPGAVLGRSGRIAEDRGVAEDDSGADSVSSSGEDDESEEVSSDDSDLADSTDGARRGMVRSTTLVAAPRFRKGIRAVLKNRSWFWTSMCISAVCYICQSVNYFWQNTFKFMWQFSDEHATYSLLLTTAGGGLLGVVLGPKIFDGYLGGFETKHGVTTCLRWVRHAAFLATLLSSTAAAVLFGEAYYTGKYPTLHSDADEVWSHRSWMLVVVIACVLLIFMLIQGVQGTLYAINTAAAKPTSPSQADLRPVAVAMTQSMQNIFGFALGTLLPSQVAEFVGKSFNQEEPQDIVRSVEYSISMALSVLGAIPLLVAAFVATRVAAREEDDDDRPLTK